MRGARAFANEAGVTPAQAPTGALGHEAFRLQVAHHLGALGRRYLTVDVEEALAVGFQHRNHLLALLGAELGDQFSSLGMMVDLTKTLAGIDRGKDARLQAALLAPEPVEAAEENGKRRSARYRRDRREKIKVIGLDPA